MKVKCEITVDLNNGEYEASFFKVVSRHESDEIEYNELVSALREVLEDLDKKAKNGEEEQITTLLN